MSEETRRPSKILEELSRKDDALEKKYQSELQAYEKKKQKVEIEPPENPKREYLLFNDLGFESSFPRIRQALSEEDGEKHYVNQAIIEIPQIKKDNLDRFEWRISINHTYLVKGWVDLNQKGDYDFFGKNCIGYDFQVDFITDIRTNKQDEGLLFVDLLKFYLANLDERDKIRRTQSPEAKLLKNIFGEDGSKKPLEEKSRRNTYGTVFYRGEELCFEKGISICSESPFEIYRMFYITKDNEKILTRIIEWSTQKHTENADNLTRERLPEFKNLVASVEEILIKQD